MGDAKPSAARHLARGLAVFGAGALVLHGWRLGLTLLGSHKRYRIDRNRLAPADSSRLRDYVSTITDAQVHSDTRVSMLVNGDAFYPSELEAVRAAQHSINLQAYEFQEGEITREFLAVLEEQARAGVEVRVVVDALGSWHTRSKYFDGLRRAGGRFEWYHPVNSREWPYLNHRTHRKLLVVDGTVGFVGGAGFADHWIKPTKYGRWRDTMFRVEGSVVAALNSVFAQNWAETTGEILAGTENFRYAAAEGGVPAMVVTSMPHAGATRARILYQALIESAQKSIHITTPYFVPDRSARQALECAAGRGISVRILTTGRRNDHPMTRRLSHALEHQLLKAGAALYEYQPSMIHAKLMTIDGIWTVAGSTNFDHRSFELNHEVNIAVFDRSLAAAVDEQFARDLTYSQSFTLARESQRDLIENIEGDASWVVRREQ
jgi:cardiolipin synthase